MYFLEILLSRNFCEYVLFYLLKEFFENSIFVSVEAIKVVSGN
jgi:hypothetical protein